MAFCQRVYGEWESLTQSDGDFYLANLFTAKLLFDYAKIFTNRVLNVLNRLDVGSALRPAPWQAGNRNGKAFFRR
jgi:hypothetical protein